MASKQPGLGWKSINVVKPREEQIVWVYTGGHEPRQAYWRDGLFVDIITGAIINAEWWQEV